MYILECICWTGGFSDYHIAQCSSRNLLMMLQALHSCFSIQCMVSSAHEQLYYWWEYVVTPTVWDKECREAWYVGLSLSFFLSLLKIILSLSAVWLWCIWILLFYFPKKNPADKNRAFNMNIYSILSICSLGGVHVVLCCLLGVQASKS